MNHRRLLYPGALGLLALVVSWLLITSPFLPTQPLAWAQQTQPAATVTTIRWSMRWDETRLQTIALPLIAAFEAQHPTIQIEVENSPQSSVYYRALNIGLDQGTAPDVFYPATQIAYAWAQQERLLPLDPWVATDKLDLSAFDPTTLALYRDATQGLYCLPADIATLAVFYNKTLFDAAGVAYPQAPWQWADLLKIAQQLTREVDGDKHYGIDRFDAYWPLVVWTATGHNIFDDPYAPTEFLLGDEKAVDALQWLADLSLVHGVMPAVASAAAPAGAVENRFLAGQAAMQITGHWQVPAYLATADFPFDFVELPSGAVAANRSDGSCFAIARNTPHPAAAWTFVKFLAGPDGLGAQLLAGKQQMTPALLPLQASAVLRGATNASQLNTAAFLPKNVQRFALADPLHPIYRRWATVAEAELGALWAGDQSAEKAVDALAEEAEEILRNLAIPSGAAAAQQAVPTVPRQYYVAPTGDDQNSGESPLTALATLQRALDLVQPGDTVHLQPGDYFENVVSQIDGRADAPITIMGPADAVLHGNGDASAAFYLTHDYYTLTGFTMDGLYGDPSQQDGYTDKLLYVQGQHHQRGVTGLQVLQMTFQHAGGECVRLRYFAQGNEIAYSTFLACGVLDYEFADGGKNGEAIYIGTSSTQWDDGKNPTANPDLSRDNWIHHNVMNTQGNECVEVKEGGSHNLIEHNTCTGQLDPDSAGIGARGSGNIIRYNRIYGNVGAGVRLGGHEVDGIQYGIENQVYGNYILRNVAGGINIAVAPQAKICNNVLTQNLGKSSFGDGSDAYDPAEPCS